MLSELFQQFSSNQLLSGLAGAGIGTSLFYSARTIPVAIWNRVKRFFSYSVEFRSTDPGFKWIERFLAKQKFIMSRNYCVSFEHFDDRPPEHIVTQGVGTHYFWHQRRLIRVRRYIMEKQGTDDFQEIIDLTIIFGNVDRIKSIVDLTKNCETTTKGIQIYSNNGGWYSDKLSLIHTLHSRPMSTVFLPDGMATDMIADIQQHLENKELYQRMGLPYRRTFLFEGIPGTGKSTFIQALADHFGYSIAICSLQSLTEQNVVKFFNSGRKNMFYVIEDIDSFKVVRERDSESTDKLSFSTLLNVMDGMLAAEERIIFLTTNHMENLDSAILRPGRIDKVVHFDYSNWDQITSQYNFYYPDDSIKYLQETWLSSDKKVTTAMMQEIYMRHRNDSSKFIKALGQQMKAESEVI